MWVCDLLQELFVMVAFILHLGNVTFQDDDEGFAIISSNETLDTIDNVRIYTGWAQNETASSSFY